MKLKMRVILNIVSEKSKKGYRKEFHFVDGNEKYTESDNGNDIFVDRNEVTREILIDVYRELFCELGEGLNISFRLIFGSITTMYRY